MTVNEAINILELHNPFLGADENLTEAFDMAIKALTAQQWIPCSERLPDTNRDVLLQFGNSMGVGFWEHNSWGINTGDDIYSEIGEREAQPIAWRELPEPWEGER